VAFRIRRILPLDHKVIGLQYALTALVFLLLGFSLMLILRWQLARSGRTSAALVSPYAGSIAA
jgi:cytochrome c oxidase subunit 1